MNKCDSLLLHFSFRSLFLSIKTFIWITQKKTEVKRMVNVYISWHTKKNDIGISLLLVVTAPTWHHWTVLKYWNAPITAASLTNTWNGDLCSLFSRSWQDCVGKRRIETERHTTPFAEGAVKLILEFNRSWFLLWLLLLPLLLLLLLLTCVLHFNDRA